MKPMAKILFVEDEQALQKTLCEALRGHDYEVLSAFNGEEGLKMAQAHKPELILLDLILPKKDGFEVLAALKADPETKAIPVVVLTNLEGVGDVDRALELGATTYLVKANYNLDDVIAKVRKALGEE